MPSWCGSLKDKTEGGTYSHLEKGLDYRDFRSFFISINHEKGKWYIIA
jgi:hypothetical protein